MISSKRFKKWAFSGLTALACAGAYASGCPSQPDEFESISQISDQTSPIVGALAADETSSFHPQESFAALTPDERQNFSDRIQDLRTLANNRLTEAKAIEDDFSQPGDCGGIKTKRACLKEQVKELTNAGKDPSTIEQLLDRPNNLKQSAAQLNELAEAGEKLHTNGSLTASLKNEASGIYATFRDSWKYMIRKEPLIAITVGLAAYAAAKPFEAKTSAHFNDPQHKWTGAKYQIGNILGQGYTILAPAWLAAKYSGNEKLSRVADNWIAGGIMDALITTGLKYTVREKRPDGTNTQGFPSGHTTTAFMMAKIVQDEMGSKWGIPAYIAASYVGMSRVGGARHTPGQALAGAGLGYAIGSAVSQASAEQRSQSSMAGHFRVGDTKVEYQALPAMTPSGAGMAVVGAF